MRIVSLVENTPGAPGCGVAHGLSLYIEAGGHRVLMDAGPSDLLTHNAQALGVDLKSVDTVVISHGHYDHANGLTAFHAINPSARVYIRRGADGAFLSDSTGDLRYIGVDPAIPGYGQIQWVDGDLCIDDTLQLFTDIRGRRFRPAGNRHLLMRAGDDLMQDPFAHEQCLVVTEGDRRVMLSGCAHSGILNIMARCIEVTGAPPDVVVSGFHMKKDSEHTPGERRTILEVAEELLSWPCRYYTCHCTGLPAYDMMKSVMGDRLRYLHCGEAIDPV